VQQTLGGIKLDPEFPLLQYPSPERDVTIALTNTGEGRIKGPITVEFQYPFGRNEGRPKYGACISKLHLDAGDTCHTYMSYNWFEVDKRQDSVKSMVISYNDGREEITKKIQCRLSVEICHNCIPE
jgi:hypothetical protein